MTRTTATTSIMTRTTALKTLPIHSSEKLRKTRSPEFDPDKELPVLCSIRPMMRAAGNLEDIVLDLPYKTPSLSIKTTNKRQLKQIPKETYEVLCQAEDRTPETPRGWHHDTYLHSWISRVEADSIGLSRGILTKEYGGEKIDCAYRSQTTLYPRRLVQRLLREGEGSPLAWHAVSLLSSPSRRYGCLLVTYHLKGRHIEATQILRSELLALLYLLEISGERDVKYRRASCMSRTVFVMSFIGHQVRVIEARLHSPSVIEVSIHTVLDEVPASEGSIRDEKYEELVRWALFVEGDDKQRHTSSSSVKSAASVGSSATSSSSAGSAATINSDSNRGNDESSPNSSFTGEYDKEDK